MPAVAYTPVIVGGVDRVVDLGRKAKIISRVEHGSPLKRGKWLGDKKGCADRDLAAPVPLLLRYLLIIGRRNFIREIGDGCAVFRCLCGKSQHKI